MNCKDVRQWIAGGLDREIHKDLKIHLAACDRCRSIVDLDTRLEAQLRSGLSKTRPPAGLMEKMETRIGQKLHKNRRSALLRRGLAPVAFAAAIVLFLWFQPFSTDIRSLDDMGFYALANHFDVDAKLDIHDSRHSEVAKAMSDRLGFTVTIPDLSVLGLRLVGGRKCTIGGAEAAYLVCDRNGDRVSIFVIQADDLDFQMREQRRYRITDARTRIQIWKEAGLVYVMVEETGNAIPPISDTALI